MPRRDLLRSSDRPGNKSHDALAHGRENACVENIQPLETTETRSKEQTRSQREPTTFKMAQRFSAEASCLPPRQQRSLRLPAILITPQTSQAFKKALSIPLSFPVTPESRQATFIEPKCFKSYFRASFGTPSGCGISQADTHTHKEGGGKCERGKGILQGHLVLATESQGHAFPKIR